MDLIERGGGTGPKKPQQPAYAKVLNPASRA